MRRGAFGTLIATTRYGGFPGGDSPRRWRDMERAGRALLESPPLIKHMPFGMLRNLPARGPGGFARCAASDTSIFQLTATLDNTDTHGQDNKRNARKARRHGTQAHFHFDSCLQ